MKYVPLLLTFPVRRRSDRHPGTILGNSHRTQVAVSLYYLPSGIAPEMAVVSGKNFEKSVGTECASLVGR